MHIEFIAIFCTYTAYIHVHAFIHTMNPFYYYTQTSAGLFPISIATLKLSVFHNSLLTTFEPIVDDYLTGLDTSITNDMKAFFDNETWTPVS